MLLLSYFRSEKLKWKELSIFDRWKKRKDDERHSLPQRESISLLWSVHWSQREDVFCFVLCPCSCISFEQIDDENHFVSTIFFIDFCFFIDCCSLGSRWPTIHPPPPSPHTQALVFSVNIRSLSVVTWFMTCQSKKCTFWRRHRIWRHRIWLTFKSEKTFDYRSSHEAIDSQSNFVFISVFLSLHIYTVYHCIIKADFATSLEEIWRVTSTKPSIIILVYKGDLFVYFCLAVACLTATEQMACATAL